MLALGAFGDRFEGERAIVHARDFDFNGVDIDRLDRQAIGIFARQDHARTAKADIRWTVFKTDLNFFFAPELIAISGREAFGQSQRIA